MASSNRTSPTLIATEAVVFSTSTLVFPKTIRLKPLTVAVPYGAYAHPHQRSVSEYPCNSEPSIVKLPLGQ